jgi:DNA ligase-1
MEQRIRPLRELSPEEQQRQVTSWWDALDAPTLFVVNKLLTGALRVGVSRGLAVRALSAHLGIDAAVLQHRLMGAWVPGADFWERLRSEDTSREDLARPYPFFLASPLPGEIGELGDAGDWLAEWKWDGIRAQLVRRGGRVYLWSRGEDLVTDRFPEVADAARALPPGTVIDGELLAWRDGTPLPFALLQRRIGRKNVTKRLQTEAPVVLMAYDLLEREGRDLRGTPFRERREQLAAAVGDTGLLVSPEVPFATWPELAARREESRSRGVEGVMLKRADSAYGVGRRRGAWWKWKVEPYTLDTVLLYAQAGHGRRANLHTDYTLGVWAEEGLVPLAKAYSGLDLAEIRELDRWIRRHTRERYGPVRAVEPGQVLEIAFEGIASSSRHKSGVAVRFPRIARWRRDKQPEEADRLETVHELLRTNHGGG